MEVEWTSRTDLCKVTSSHFLEKDASPRRSISIKPPIEYNTQEKTKMNTKPRRKLASCTISCPSALPTSQELGAFNEDKDYLFDVSTTSTLNCPDEPGATSFTTRKDDNADQTYIATTRDQIDTWISFKFKDT